MMRSFMALQEVDPGYATGNVLTFFKAPARPVPEQRATLIRQTAGAAAGHTWRRWRSARPTRCLSTEAPRTSRGRPRSAAARIRLRSARRTSILVTPVTSRPCSPGCWPAHLHRGRQSARCAVGEGGDRCPRRRIRVPGGAGRRPDAAGPQSGPGPNAPTNLRVEVHRRRRPPAPRVADDGRPRGDLLRRRVRPVRRQSLGAADDR